MATLTYDPTEATEGELSEEEQNSLEVGEKLAEQEQELLAGKFQNAEELEKAYNELSKKLGEPKEESQAEEEPEAKAEDQPEDKNQETNILEDLWTQAQDRKFSDETLTELNELKPGDIAKLHLKYRSEVEEKSDLSKEDVGALKEVAGGEERYTKMMDWATSNLSEKEIEMYDNVMEQGNPLAAFFAVQSLLYRFNDFEGIDGELITGKNPTSTKGVAYRSQAEVVRAMQDPRYDKDPAYRQDVYDKLERSNLQY